MDKINQIFAEYFSNRDIRLPKEATQGRTLGEIHAHGWFIHYQSGTGNRGDYRDFYASYRMANDRQNRIFDSAESESLLIYDDRIVYPANVSMKDQEEDNR